MSSKLRLFACMLAVGLAFMASPTQAHAEWLEFNGARNGTWSTSPIDQTKLQAIPTGGDNYPDTWQIYNPVAIDKTFPNHIYCYLQFEFKGASFAGRTCLITFPNVFTWSYGDASGTNFVNSSRTFLSGTPKFYFYINGQGWTQFFPDGQSMFTVPDSGVNAIRIAYDFVPSIQYLSERKTHYLISMSQHRLYVDIPADESLAVYQQTTEVMDTTGSDSVLDSALSGGESALTDRLGFVGQAMSIPNAFFEGVTSEEDSVVHFPGISVMGLNIPAADIDIWSALPNLKTPCKTICTFVFIVAWLRGIQAIYGRIVQGDKVVTVEGAD